MESFIYYVSLGSFANLKQGLEPGYYYHLETDRTTIQMGPHDSEGEAKEALEVLQSDLGV